MNRHKHKPAINPPHKYIIHLPREPWGWWWWWWRGNRLEEGGVDEGGRLGMNLVCVDAISLSPTPPSRLGGDELAAWV